MKSCHSFHSLEAEKCPSLFDTHIWVKLKLSRPPGPPGLLRTTLLGFRCGLLGILRYMSSEITVTSAPLSILKFMGSPLTSRSIYHSVSSVVSQLIEQNWALLLSLQESTGLSQKIEPRKYVSSVSVATYSSDTSSRFLR